MGNDEAGQQLVDDSYGVTVRSLPEEQMAHRGKRRKGSVRGMTVADFPELAAQLLPELNGGARPEDFAAGGSRAATWKCSMCGHIWETTTVVARVKGSRCPECVKENARTPLSLAQRSPELAAEWHPEKNNCSPDEVAVGNNTRVAWWLCKQGHEWRALITSRFYTGRGCGICNNSTPSGIEGRLRGRLNASRFGFGPPAQSDVALEQRWPNGHHFRVDFLGRLPETKRSVIVEYDGRRWHAPEDRRAVDTEKTQALLDAGFVMVRVREDDLPHLAMDHPDLLQISHRWSNRDEDLAPLMGEIEAWLDSMDRS